MVVFPDPEGAEKTNNFPLKSVLIFDKYLQDVGLVGFFIKYLKFVL